MGPNFLLARESQLGALIRSKNWAETPLGAIETWPEPLCTAVGMCLSSTFATFVCWGQDLIQIYNDAAVSILRNKHPHGLGRSARLVWPEIWPDVGGILEHVMNTGEAGGGEDLGLVPDRGGPAEEAFFTFTCSAIPGPGGKAAGLCVLVQETTEKVRAEREKACTAERLARSDERHAFLLKLGDRLRSLTDAVEIQAEASRLLGEHLSLYRVLYADIDEKADRALVYRGWSCSGTPSFEGEFSLSSFGPPVVAELASGRTARVADTHSDVRTRQNTAQYEAIGFRAAIVVPLIRRGTFVRVLAVHAALPRAWTDFDVALVEETAERTWEAVERARAEAALRESEARHAFLLALGDRLRDMTEAEAMAEKAAEMLGRHLKVNRVLYGEMEPIEDYVTIWSDWTDGTMPSAKGRYRMADFGAEVTDGYRRGEIRRTDDTSAPNGAVSAGDQKLGIGAAIGVPMLKGGRLVAGMSVHSARPRHWADSEVELVREVAERIWSYIERSRSEAALRLREEKYRTLFSSVDEGFCVLEVLYDASGTPVDTVHIEANPAYTKHTGLSQVVGKKSSELVPEVAPHWLPVYDRVVRTGVAAHFENRSSSLNRWFELRVVRVGEPDDRRVAVLLNDVTARRRAAEELRAAAERDAFLVTLADALGPLADPIEIQAVVTRILGQRFGADRVHYAEVSGDEAVIRCDYTGPGVSSAAGTHHLTTFEGFSYREVQAGRTLAVNDITSDERLGSCERDMLTNHFGARSRVSVPLIKGGALRGLLSLQFSLPHVWGLDEVELIEATAERTWAALERARAEAAQRESEERFRAIVRNVRDYAIFLTDACGVITEWPEGAESVTGHSAGDVIGKPVSILYTPEDIAGAQHERELAQAKSDGRVERETWRVRKGGERFFANEITTVVRDAAGKLVGFTRVARDLTEKKRADEVLRRLAEADAYRIELADALRAVSDPIEIQAVAARILGRHLRATRVLYSEVREEHSIVHRDYVDGAVSLVGVHPLAPYDEFFRRRCEAGVTTAIADTANDERLPLNERRALKAYDIGAMVSVPLAKVGKLRATFDVHQATERSWTVAEVLRIEETAERTWAAVERAHAEALRRSSEERFRRALEIETVGVVFFDAKGDITRANDAFCRMIGYTQTEVMGRSLCLNSLIWPDVNGARGLAFEDFDSTGSTRAYEQRCVRKDGSYFWGLFAAKRLDATERVEFILDITERKQAEEALAAAHAELEDRVEERTKELARTNRALAEEVAERKRDEQIRSDLLRRLDSAQEDERRRVARDLHDQVGQTLTALTLAVRATRDAGELPPAASLQLTEVQHVAEQIGREVHELAVRLRPTALDDLGLHAALGQLLSDWSGRMNIEVDYQLSDLEAARLAPGFETVIYRVVQEALTNVARHAKAARASVVVQRVNGAVITVVEDDGVGFEVNVSDTGRLGLLGLRERMALAGGTLDIESAPGQGTTLIARIPC